MEVFRPVGNKKSLEYGFTEEEAEKMRNQAAAEQSQARGEPNTLFDPAIYDRAEPSEPLEPRRLSLEEVKEYCDILMDNGLEEEALELWEQYCTDEVQ